MSIAESKIRITTADEIAAMETKPPTTETVAITVRPPSELAGYLTELAWSQRRSRSDLVVEILHDFAEQEAGNG